MSGNPSKNPGKAGISISSMRNLQKALVLSLCVLQTAQEETKTKKRKIYRTQSGSIIEAPRPLFERSIKESEPKLEINSANKTNGYVIQIKN